MEFEITYNNDEFTTFTSLLTLNEIKDDEAQSLIRKAMDSGNTLSIEAADGVMFVDTSQVREIRVLAPVEES